MPNLSARSLAATACHRRRPRLFVRARRRGAGPGRPAVRGTVAATAVDVPGGLLQRALSRGFADAA